MSRPAKFENTIEREIIVEGQLVHLTLDADTGEVLMASAFYWEGAEHTEKIAKLAIATVQRELALGRAAAANKTRTKTSAETRRSAGAAHWSAEWLQGAYRSGLGAKRLAQMARRQCAINRPDIDAEKRAEITEYRARRFLQNNPTIQVIQREPGDV